MPVGRFEIRIEYLQTRSDTNDNKDIKKFCRFYTNLSKPSTQYNDNPKTYFGGLLRPKSSIYSFNRKDKHLHPLTCKSPPPLPWGKFVKVHDKRSLVRNCFWLQCCT